MDIRVLKYFLMAAREENITKAAGLLHITQPTLSRQLMQLEQELGVKLFKRSNHSIILTDEGMLLKRRAQEMIALEEKVKLELTQEENELSGVIAIGCGELKSVDFLSEILLSFKEKYPLVQYDLYSGNVDSIKDRIEKGLIDIGLLMEPADIRKYEFIRMPVKETFGVLAHKDSSLAGKSVIHPKDLAGTPLLAANRELVQNELRNWLGEYAEEVNITATYNLTYNAAMMAQKGMGSLLTLELNQHFDDLVFIPVSPKLEVSSVLVWKKNQAYSQAALAFIKFARSYLADKSIHE